MSKLISKFYQWATGMAEDDLSALWQWNYFLTRSRPRAYWLTLRDGYGLGINGGGSGC